MLSLPGAVTATSVSGNVPTTPLDIPLIKNKIPVSIGSKFRLYYDTNIGNLPQKVTNLYNIQTGFVKERILCLPS